MKTTRLQEMATKFYLESVSIAKDRKEKLISTNSNDSFMKLKRVLNYVSSLFYLYKYKKIFIITQDQNQWSFVHLYM